MTIPGALAEGRLAIVRALADALAFVLPVACAGCAEPDVALCERCLVALRPQPARASTPGGLVVWSGTVFDGPPARAMRALKADGRTGLAGAFAPALRAAASRLGATRDAVYVPIPTSAAAYRRRGYRVPDLLARRAGLRPIRLLRVARRTADQRGLDRDRRRGNVAGSFRSRAATGSDIVLVDDVVTTGATLDEAARAVRAAGGRVVGAVTAVAVPRRSGSRDEGPVTRRIHT